MARFLFFCSLGAACSGTGEGDSGWSSQEIALHSPIIRMMTFHIINSNSYLKYYSRVLQFLHQCALTRIVTLKESIYLFQTDVETC